MSGSHRLTMPLLRNIPIILFVLVFLLFSVLDQRFFAVANASDILRSSAFVGILAVGMTIVLLTGGIDLSVGAIMYITGAVIAMLLEGGTPVLLAIVAGLVAGTLWGCLNAFLIARVGLIPFVATLATLTAGRGLGLLITESRHIAVPEEMRFGAASYLGIPLPVIVFAAVVLVACGGPPLHRQRPPDLRHGQRRRGGQEGRPGHAAPDGHASTSSAASARPWRRSSRSASRAASRRPSARASSSRPSRPRSWAAPACSVA